MGAGGGGGEADIAGGVEKGGAGGLGWVCGVEDAGVGMLGEGEGRWVERCSLLAKGLRGGGLMTDCCDRSLLQGGRGAG